MEYFEVWSKTARWLALVPVMQACGCTEVPPSLPSTQAYQRNVPRTELVEFVVDDGERAAKVRSLYLKLERLVLRTQQERVMRTEALMSGDQGSHTPEKVRELVVGVGRSEEDALREYIDIQMQLRASTTPEEFSRLNELKE